MCLLQACFLVLVCLLHGAVTDNMQEEMQSTPVSRSVDPSTVLVVSLTFPCALLAGVLWCLCLNRCLSIHTSDKQRQKQLARHASDLSSSSPLPSRRHRRRLSQTEDISYSVAEQTSSSSASRYSVEEPTDRNSCARNCSSVSRYSVSPPPPEPNSCARNISSVSRYSVSPPPPERSNRASRYNVGSAAAEHCSILGREESDTQISVAQEGTNPCDENYRCDGKLAIDDDDDDLLEIDLP